MNTDLIIIGSGPGGYHTAGYAAKNGLRVVIVEEAEVGGTCLNRGCIPTKTFCHEADCVEAAAEFTGARPEIDFQRITRKKQSVVEQLRGGVETLMTAPGITLVRGCGVLKDAKTVTVDGEDYTAENIIIATGSHSKMPPVEGIDSDGVMTSTELLDVQAVPKRLCIIGAGVIGMEFASAFRSFGSEVTVVEFLKECLPVMDSDIAKRLRKAMEKCGVEFYMQSGVKRIERNGQTLCVTFERKGKEATVEANAVLVATGRAANTEGLGLEAAGVEYDRKGITVDENMQTNVPGIYAIGDVNGRMMLAHAASMQGVRAVNTILGKDDEIDFDIMPSAVFTNPEAASVGVSEDYCKANGIDVVVRKGFYRSNGKALASNAAEGMVKLMADPCGKIIGCHAYGAHAADLIQEVCAIMNYRGTVADLHDIIHTHPTLEEVLQATAEQENDSTNT